MTDPTLEELVQELIEETRVNQRWLRFLAWDNVKNTLSETFDEGWEYHLYEDLDGNTSIRDLSEGMPKGKDAVGNRLNNWQRVGLVEKAAGGQYDKLISLEALNIDLPELSKEDDNDEGQ